MTKAEYDPGASPTPWEAKELNVVDANGRTIGNASGTRSVANLEANVLEDERDARNLRLFAAAPDLLDALKRQLWHKETCGGACERRGQPKCVDCVSRAAVVKATGATVAVNSQ